MHPSLPIPASATRLAPHRLAFWGLLIFMLAGHTLDAQASHGIFAGLVKIGGSFYNLKNTSPFPPYQDASLGSYTTGQTLTLNGGELKTYKNSGDNVTGANLFYAVYPQGARSGAVFADYNLPFAAELGNGDQSWNTYGGTVNLLAGLPVGTYTLEFYGRAGINYNGGGSGFDYENNNNNPTNYTATFVVTASPLPVELTAFEATRRDADAALTWATASEKNNQGFEVQVSTTGYEFRTLAFVAGAGSSTAPHRYQFADTEAGKAGRRYYRLRQADTDGRSSFSPVRTVAFGPGMTLTVGATPNPFEGELVVMAEARTAQATSLVLYDAVGRPVLTRLLEVAAGSNRLPVTGLAALPAGTYFGQLLLDGQLHHIKAIRK